MKKLICMLLALMMVLTMAVSFASCGEGEDGKENTENEEGKTENEDEVIIPAGYTVYKNGSISFAYPENWEKSTDDIIMDENGNTINVVTEDKTDLYDNLTKEEYEETYVPVYTEMGMTVTDVSVEHIQTNGLKVVKVAYDLSVQGVSMKQTQYVTTAGEKTYTVTITLVSNVYGLVENVFNTLSKA